MDDVWKAITALIALTAALVAFGQWLLTKEKLRLDLFEKRYKVFAVAKTFLAATARSGRVSDEGMYEFKKETADSIFLFGRGVVAYLKEIKVKLDRQSWIRQRDDSGPQMFDEEGPFAPLEEADRQRLLAEEEEIRSWVSEQVREAKLQRVFDPYLRFRDQQPWFAIGAVALIIIVGAFALGIWFAGVPRAPAPSDTQKQTPALHPPVPAPAPQAETDQTPPK